MAMKNRAIKISVSIPLNLLEKLDKLTTYKGRSRSQYISNAVSQRIHAQEITPEVDINRAIAIILGNRDKVTTHLYYSACAEMGVDPIVEDS